MRHTRSRQWRTALKSAAIAIILVFAVAAGAFAGGEVEEDESTGEVLDNQAPALSALVEEGELPPLQERLPSNPKVVQVREEIGRYGGTIRAGIASTADAMWLNRTVLYDGLVVWNPDWTEVVPGYASSYEVSSDVRTFTFELRDGLRWSDGQPMTTADVQWWWENVLLHEEITPTIGAMWLNEDGTPAELEILDDLRFRVSFTGPKSFFLDNLAGFDPVPMHYAREFHADFNDEAQANAEADGFESWVDRFTYAVDLEGPWVNPDLPTMNPWVVVEGATYTGDTTRVSFERNPYYYKVDSEGNQLPYVDQWDFDIFEDPEVQLLRVLAGEIDFNFRHVNSTENRPVLFDGQTEGDYHFVRVRRSASNEAKIALNLTHDDAAFREMVNNKDFRIGLSHAIDREEISEILHAGQTRPWQPAPFEEMPFYNDQLATQYTEFDLDLANEYLDSAGYERDAGGNRIGPDGEPIVIDLDVSLGRHLDIMELVKAHWERVGIQANLNFIDRTLMMERRNANEHQAHIWFAQAAARNALTNASQYAPIASGAVQWAPRWAAWAGAGNFLSAGVEPEEPPASAQRQIELFDQIQAAHPDDHTALMSELLQIAADEFWQIGTVTRPSGFGTVHNRIGNPIGDHWDAPSFSNPGPLELTQMFIGDGR